MRGWTGISLVFLLVFLVACTDSTSKKVIQPIEPKLEIKQADGALTDVIQFVPVIEPLVALTFNGLAEAETIRQILQQLASSNIKATFFVEGMRVAQEPELVEEILKQGHEVESATLSLKEMAGLSYEETYEEIFLANEVFKEHVNLVPKFVRSRSGDATENMQLVASTLGMEAVISSSINPQDRNMQSAEEMAEYIERFLSRGAIIHLNTYINPEIIDVIPLLVDIADEKNYTFATISELLNEEYVTEDIDTIEGYDAIKINPDYEQVTPNIFYRKETEDRVLALTFDDWASEERTLEILDILNKYNIKSTFFLIGSGVEKAPHIARLIADEGHEIASHSYYHKDITEMSAEELQDDIVKAHQALTYALQESPLLYFRPAQGLIDDDSAKVVAATGIETIALYDIASFDWNEDFTAEDIYQRVMERVGPGKVIVMHVLDGTKTVEALPMLIEQLYEDGYSFEKLSKWIDNSTVGSVE